jgi:phosphonate transport system substrate-binding protein
VRNAGHEANAMAVANKQVDAATNNTENMRRLEKTNPGAFKNLKVIWQSPLIPSDPIVWRKDLDEGTKATVYKFFISYGRMGTPDEVANARKVMAALQWAPFRPSSDAQLYPIRQLEINKTMLKIKADAKMPEDEKKAKIAELRKKNDEIAKLMEQAPSM